MAEDNGKSDVRSRDFLRWSRLIGTSLALYALFGGIISFVGWASDMRRLTDWINTGISIQPNAAIAVVTAAIAVLLVGYGWRRCSAVLGIFVWIIGASTIFQIVSDIDLGVNTYFTFGHEWGRGGVLVPGRMGTPGAVSLTIIGLAIVLVSLYGPKKTGERSKRLRLTAIVLCLVTLTVSTLSMTGYFYGAEVLYTLPRLTVIAVQTATFIFAVSLALISFIPDAGPTRIMTENSAAGIMTRHVVPIIILIPILMGFLRLAGEQAGLFDLAFGTASRTVLEIVLMLILLWLTARSISREARKTASQTAALQESERRRKLAQDAGNVGIWDWDIRAGKTYWSENMWGFYDEDPSDIDPDEEYWSAHLHVDDRERVKLNIHTVIDTGESKFFDEFRIVRPDGSVRWLESRAEVSYDKSGTAIRMYGVNMDITHRREIEERIRISENQLRLVTDTVPALISYIDSDLHYRFVNRTYGEWFGSATSEIVGRSMREILGDAAIEALLPKIDLVMSGQEISFEADLKYKAAGQRFVHVSYIPDLDFDGSVKGFYALVSDLSDLKKAQDQLQQAHDELEVRVKERTKELAGTNNALVQEMQEREVAERQRIDLLRRLVSGQETERRRIARDLHDHLGQRLTALRLKIASLKEIHDDPTMLFTRIDRLQEIAERIDSEVSFLAWELRPSTLDDLGLLDALRAFVNEWSLHYEIVAEFHSSGLPKDRLDPEIETHLYRITQEALNNIAKHAQAKNISVLLERRSENIILILEDDGIGFKTREKNGRETNKGTGGMGLVGMRERVSLIGGSIEIESAPGKGTTIYVRLPISTEIQ